LGALGYLFYKSKDQVQLLEDLPSEKLVEEEDIYKDLEDLFI